MRCLKNSELPVVHLLISCVVQCTVLTMYYVQLDYKLSPMLNVNLSEWGNVLNIIL